ncbi:MAG: InlB B-repeat-containing protein, partial [[Bacteroides] pectinophilus]|nr:InlB B-repeat-containing protein [[Bacteroides] pectinophilus]
MNRLRKLASVVLCAALIAGYAPAATQTALAADNSGAKTVTGSAAYAGSGSAAEPETASATASSSATKESGTAKTASGSTQTTDAANAATGKTEAATGTQAAAKTQAATEASSTAVKAKLKTAGRTASETEFKNNGYPYGMDMGRSSVTLVMELESGTIDTAEWSRSTDKNGEYQAVDNSVAGAQISNTETKSSLVMDDTALGDEKYWYKCTVNGKESEAVQLVYASSYSNSGKNIKVVSGGYGGDANCWYVSNGAMAYNVKSLDSKQFNVIGRYVKDGTEYWINTSYNGYWEMYSSDKQTPESSDKSTLELDAFRVSFNKDDSHRVLFEADLADGQTGLSVGADVMLADSSITDYADNASLKGIFDSKTGNIASIQMVGAATIDDALPTDPAFVLHYMDTPSKYWIGFYSERSGAYWSNNLYDNSRFKENIKDTKDVDGQKVATEVAGKDSYMTTSWTGIESGSTVSFQFGVGSVEEAGATIKMQTTSTTIKLDDADSSLEYAVYGPDNTPVQLVDENGNPLFESDGTTPLYWRQVGDGETSITFYGLTANTKYTVMSRKKNTTDTPDKAGDITTSVDPTKPKDDSKPVECTEGTTSLAFINLNDDYTYQLQDKDGSIVSGTSWVEPSDGAYTFTNLHPGVDYYLTARTSSNTKSDKVKYTTRKTKLTYDANVAGSEIAVPASQDKSYDEAVTIPAMVPVREDYVFAGWSTSSDGSTTVYKAGSSFDEPSDYDQILYAIWKKPVRQIALIVSKPVINAAFVNTASYSAAEGITGISAVEWTPAAQTAEYDVKYTATVMASIADGYMAAADLKATVNGKSAAVTVMNDSAVKVSYTFAAIRNMTDAEKISEAEQIIKDALADAPAYNGTNKNDLQKVVDKALSDAGITDVTADVGDFSNDNATTDNDGNVTANIKIKTSSEQSDSPVTKKVDRLPSTDDEKTEYAKKVIEEAIKNIPDVNNVTREDVQKTVDEALAKAGIPGVEAVVGSINVNPADESGAGSVAGVVNIKSGSSRADFNINKDITRLPSNDEEKVEYAGKVVQDALAGMTISDTTTKDDIQNVIDNALSKAGITDVDVNVGDLDVTSPTTDTAGRFIGSINITSGSASGEAAVNKSVAKKPATDEDRIELAKTVIEEALAGTDVNNGMSISDIQN